MLRNCHNHAFLYVWPSRVGGVPHPRVGAWVSLTLREVRLIGPDSEPRHPCRSPPIHMDAHAWFFLLLGERWHLFCCCNYLRTHGKPLRCRSGAALR